MLLIGASLFDRLPLGVARVLQQLSLPSAGIGEWQIPAGREQQVLALIEDEASTPLSFPNISISGGEIVVDVVAAEPATVARVTITRGEDPEYAQPIVSVEMLTQPSAAVDEAIGAWVGRIRGRDGGEIWIFGDPLIPQSAYQSRLPLQPALAVVPVVHVAVCLLALATCLIVFRISAPISVGASVKITHALPAILQTILFTYWLAHWPEGRLLAELIVIQILYAYVFDFLFSVLHSRRWQAGLGPLPVVLSTNLFAQFAGDSFWCALLAIAIGLAAKNFVQRGGRHIFNPSVIGLTVVAVIDLASPGIGTPDYAHQFDSPPNMTELILALALVVQLRLPVVLATLGAALGIIGANQIAPDIAFSPVWAAVTLVLCLLITDPATIPRSDKGKLLFGAFIGAGMVTGHNLLLAAGHTDFWAKVVCIPLANLLVPVFDRLANATPNIPGLSARFAKLHVAAWLVLSIGMLSQGKADIFVGSDAADYTSPCYVSDAEVNRCEDNPMYCSLFSIVPELRCWFGQDANVVE